MEIERGVGFEYITEEDFYIIRVSMLNHSQKIKISFDEYAKNWYEEFLKLNENYEKRIDRKSVV